MKEMEKESLKDLTETITDIIKDNTVIDWVEKIDVKREMWQKLKKQDRACSVPNKQVARQLVGLGKIHYKT
ncbi:type I restriction enzyme, R subunit [Gracilibacillus orientalis]|uniref:Type I restriction enzyme, R subunit n=1 Tax=Gracilibacillus orientalis TaxID=334253 RepID=A0A1I4J3Q6_9BACI|nr:hypothetical protein [Gracilibacillus orientalis]SFL61204.1 type I restriction enzyme, R subunit [Gracilibacillus orientalis]